MFSHLFIFGYNYKKSGVTLSNIKELEKLLKDAVMPEIIGTINELNTSIEKKKKQELIDQLKYMEDVKAYFDEALLNIDNGSMTEEIALDILEGLEEMQIDDKRE